MIRISKLFILITLLLLGCWLLPWCVAFLSTDQQSVPFALYSTRLNDFLKMDYDEEKGIIREDTKGNHYTQEQTDSLLPCFYVRQLMADQRFPDSIQGMPVTPRNIQLTNFNFRANAYDLNAPVIGLYPLLESMSGRVDLVMPDDVFRITGQRIEFVVMETNTIDETKSQVFTQALLKKKFVFPARLIAGNPNARKEYDQGYLLLDAEGKLFHLKQLRGRPYVRAVSLPEGLEVEHLFVTEFNDRKTLGYLVDASHHFYVLETKGYRICKTGIPSYNPVTDDCMIIGNRFNWTMRVSNENADNYYALDANDYRLLQTLENPVQRAPFSILSFTSMYDKFVRLRWF